MVAKYLHLIAMALFVGGQLVLAVAVVPALRDRDREGMRAVARRFGAASAAALAVLALTGFWMVDDRWDSGTLHVKLGLVALLVALIFAHIRAGRAHWLQGVVFLVSLVVVGFGVALAH
jgi:putative copper export protein